MITLLDLLFMIDPRNTGLPPIVGIIRDANGAFADVNVYVEGITPNDEHGVTLDCMLCSGGSKFTYQAGSCSEFILKLNALYSLEIQHGKGLHYVADIRIGSAGMQSCFRGYCDPDLQPIPSDIYNANLAYNDAQGQPQLLAMGVGRSVQGTVAPRMLTPGHYVPVHPLPSTTNENDGDKAGERAQGPRSDEWKPDEAKDDAMEITRRMLQGL